MWRRLLPQGRLATAPPRWLPAAVGLASVVAIFALWQQLRAREEAQLAARARITSDAVQRAIDRQFESLRSATSRMALFLATEPNASTIFSTTVPRLVAETDGLGRVLLLDSTGTLLRAAPSTATRRVSEQVADAVRSRLTTRPDDVSDAGGQAAVRSQLVIGLGDAEFGIAIIQPVRLASRNQAAVVALVDERGLLAPYTTDVSAGFSIRAFVADSQVVGDPPTPDVPATLRTPLRFGSRAIDLELTPKTAALPSMLPNVVLALGLAIAALLSLTLWLARKAFEQASVVGMSRMQRAIERATDGVWELDVVEGRMHRSEALLNYLGLDRAMANGPLDGWLSRIHPDDRTRVEAALDAHLAGETDAFESEYRMRAGNETWHTIVDRGRVIERTRDDRPLRVLGISADTTERARAAAALREIGALTTMGQLAARVAHEINNPLAGIQNAFLLVRGAIPTDHPHYRFVGAIEREIARIAAVTRQLYETYRPDQSMESTSSVKLAISDAVIFLEQVNLARQVRIETDVTRAPSLVPVPDALLRQALYNLVQNALDATPAGGTIRVAATVEDDWCVIRVSDEGPGVPEAIRQRIFDPFFSTKDRSVKTGGMGIGLSLVRQSVLAVGGEITVRDRDGGGTTFEVRLPMTPITTGGVR